MRIPLEKLGSIGAVIAAAACPICFPKLALLGAVFGLGALGAYESQLVIAAQALIVLAVVGHVVAYRQHRKRWLLAVAILGAAAVFGGFYVVYSEPVIYAGLAVLVAASATDFWSRMRNRRLARAD